MALYFDVRVYGIVYNDGVDIVLCVMEMDKFVGKLLWRHARYPQTSHKAAFPFGNQVK
jgi:hypothetical protein